MLVLMLATLMACVAGATVEEEDGIVPSGEKVPMVEWSSAGSSEYHS